MSFLPGSPGLLDVSCVRGSQAGRQGGPSLPGEPWSPSIRGRSTAWGALLCQHLDATQAGVSWRMASLRGREHTRVHMSPRSGTCTPPPAPTPQPYLLKSDRAADVTEYGAAQATDVFKSWGGAGQTGAPDLRTVAFPLCSWRWAREPSEGPTLSSARSIHPRSIPTPGSPRAGLLRTGSLFTFWEALH